jgi:hypothetical protein
VSKELENSLRLNPRKIKRNRAQTPVYKETVIEIALDQDLVQQSHHHFVSNRAGINGEKVFSRGF